MSAANAGKRKMKKLTKEEIGFLRESNAIEREYSNKALQDAEKAWRYALKSKDDPINAGFILNIHKILMSNLEPSIAGKIREVPVYIGGEIRSQSKEKIYEELIEWCGVSRYPLGKPTIEEFIKNMHVVFEKIHPFIDGNGRTGRILMNLQRIKAGLPILIIREGIQQQEYYKWFR